MMNARDDPALRAGEIDLGVSDFVAVLGRRKWVIVVVALVVAAASVFSAVARKTTYTSNASVVITSGAQTSIESQQLLTTAKQLARSPAVAAIVAKNLHSGETTAQLLHGLSVSIPTDTQLLQFSYTDMSPEVAQRRTQAFVDAFQQYQGQLLDGLVAASQQVDQQLASLRADLNRAQAAGNKDDETSLAAQIGALQDRRNALLTTAPVASTISERASEPVKNNPGIKRAGVVGLVAGLVLGVLLAFPVDIVLRRRADRRRRRELVRALNTEMRSFPASEELREGS